MKLRIKRVYEGYSEDDGYRILVDRLWPRGVKKEDLTYDVWAKDIAPSNELRKWFGHDPKKWNEFQKRYYEELDENKDLVQRIISDSGSDKFTLIYSAKDTVHNQAVVIKKYIEDEF